MRFRLAVLFLVAALLVPYSLTGQLSQSEKYKYAPLVATARLWNMIRYLHPRVTGDSTQWDAALLAAIPKIEAVHTDEELAVALDSMLETLHDPCTRIAFGLPGKGVSVQSPDEDTMVIHAGNGELPGSVGAGLMLTMGIPQTSNVVWDLRGSRMPLQLSIRPDIQQLLVNGIGYAFREHSGYPAQQGPGLRNYTSALKIVTPQSSARPQQTRTRKQIFLVDKNSAVPMVAIMEQVNGRAAILSEDPPGPSQAGFTELVRVLGKVVAEVRVADLRYADGTTEFAPTRVILNRGDEAVRAAVNAIKYDLASIPGMPGERPDFDPGVAAFRNMPYAENPYPGREMRILAAMRLWGVLHYFHPSVSRMGEKWDDVLTEFLPKVAEAKDAREYYLALTEMFARSGDVNCVTGGPEMQELFGPATAPFEVRFIEKQPVITRVFKTGTAQPGDVIRKIDGKPVENRIQELSRYLSAPSAEARLAQVARFLLTAKSSRTVKLTVEGKDHTPRDIDVAWNETNQKTIPPSRRGDPVRLIHDRIGYADLERLDAKDLDAMFEKFQQTAAIIFDLRGYPKAEGAAIAARLGDRNQPVAAELSRNVVGVGTGGSDISVLETELRVPSYHKPRYKGRTVALIDDLPNSQAGENAMFLKAVNTVLVGRPAFPAFASMLTQFDLPGGIRIFFSGQAPRWPGGKPLYPEGIRPDIEVQPTIAGLREGKDEILDAAVAYAEKN